MTQLSVFTRSATMLKNVLKRSYSKIKDHSSPKGTECKKSALRCGISLAFGKYLLLTNTVASGIFMMVGDAVVQHFEIKQQKKDQKLNYKRLENMFVIGATIGTASHYFYIWLEHAFPEKTYAAIRTKMVLDQFFMAPLCIIILFFGMGYLECQGFSASAAEFKKKFLNVFVMDFIVFVPAQVINFQYLPPKYQVIYVNVVAIIYGMLMSYLKHQEH